MLGNKKINGKIPDSSGFENNGTVISTKQPITNNDSLQLNKDCFAEVNNAYSLDHLDTSITMMAWVYPAQASGGLIDFLAKGDNHVLQIVNNRELSFFAGGWGRGDCTIPLPADWQNHWHHIAGVCDGRSLRLYIDGVLKGETIVAEKADLSVLNKWTIGRNEEFPSQRIFVGYMDKVKVFAAALSEQEIIEMMKQK